jgi:hypothetical protein
MLKDFFTVWLQNHPASNFVRNSIWIYALDQTLHLVALAVFIGAVLIVDLRLLGAGMKQRPIRDVARDAQPWLIGAFLVMVVTGIPQMMSNATKEYYSPFFWNKMQTMAVALIFTFTIRHKVTMAPEGKVHHLLTKFVAVASTCLWMSVAIWGRLIGLLS